METRFGDEFEAKIEAQAQVIEDLVDACHDAELAKGETKIIERKDPEGEVVRLACVEGGRDRLKDAATFAAVDSWPGITPAEKAAFKAAADGQKRKQVIVFRSDNSEMTETVELEEAPEVPELPELPELPEQPEQ